jgi:phosphate-selective porin OprO/OprP
MSFRTRWALVGSVLLASLSARPARAEPARDVPTAVEAPDVPTPEPATIDATPRATTTATTATPEPATTAVTPSAGFPPPPGEGERMAEREIAKGIVHKPGKGLTFATADKRFSLTLSFFMHFLYTVNDTLPTPDGQQRTTQTFEVRRARTIFSGNAFTEHIKYYLHLQFAPRDLGIASGSIRQSPIFQAWTAFDRFRDFTPQIGIFFINYSRQRVQPIPKLAFVDFSLASSEFGLERDIGIDIGSKDLAGIDKLRYHVGAFMGEGTDFAKPNDFGMTYVGRLEVLPMGLFDDDYFDVDFARRRKPKLSIGVGYAFAHKDARNRPINGAAPTDGGTTDSHNVTADVMLKVAGVSLLGDVWYRQGRRRFGNAVVTDDDGNTMPAPREAARSGIGWTAQGGFLIPRAPFEIGARYSGVRGLGESSIRDLDEVGPAISYYVVQHSVKLQLDHAHGWGEGGVRTERIRVQLAVGF